MKNAILLLFFALTTTWSFSQRTVSGTIVDDTGEALIGANILVKSTEVGTISDIDGKFTLDVPADASTLVISYTGYGTQEIDINDPTTSSTIVLRAGEYLSEIVVTALGISREKKQLGYAITEVDSDDITRTSSVSPLEGLKGKVAGIDITQASGQPGASQKIRIRGTGSITGNASPLIVIDGVPQFDNFTGSNPAAQGILDRQEDFGNALSDLNPADIDNISILKGAPAAALYGSRAGSGVVLVTTKKGSLNQDLKIEYSGSYTRSEIGRIPGTQSEFGNGWSGVRDLNENGSWGPRLDGVDRLWGRVVNNQQRVKPYSYNHANSYRDAFDIGMEWQNTLAFSAGNEFSRFRLGYTNSNADGIIPTDNDSYNRNSLNFNGGINVGKWEVSTGLNFLFKNQRIVPGGQGDQGGFGNGFINELQQIPVDFAIVELEDYQDPFNNLDNYYTSFAQNPYFILNENKTELFQNRTFGNAQLKYNLLDNLSFTTRVGGDVTSNTINAHSAIVNYTPGSPNAILGASTIPGAVREQSIDRRQWNVDIFGNYDTDLSSRISLGVLAGYNAWETYASSDAITARNLVLDGYYNIGNTPDPVTAATDQTRRRTYGFFSKFDFGFDNWLYLSLSGRNDHFSTIPQGNNSGFYPAASVSAVLSDKLFSSNSVVSFLKVRAGYAEVASDADPYLSTSGFDPAVVRSGGFGQLVFPIGGITAFEVDDGQANPNLTLEKTSELEFGVEASFFTNRITLDASVYDRRTNDQIVTADVPPSTGFTDYTTNLGEISNKGIEIGLGIIPVKTKDFMWSLNYNYSKNNNKVEDLGDLDEVTIFGLSGGNDIRAVEGLSAAEHYGPGVKTTEDGQIIVNPNTGFPEMTEEFVNYGSAYHDFIMGLSNTLTWKNFSLDATIDYRNGGLLYSSVADINYFVGNAVETAYNDRNPWIIPNSVIDQGDGTFGENTTPISYDNVWSYWNDFSGNDATISAKISG